MALTCISMLRSWRWPLALSAGMFVAGTAATAANAPAPEPARAQAYARAHAAVVGVRVDVADGALSAETLGNERAGSGVVIGKDGLILTIGYLMLEAQNIQILTHDRKTLPAKAVAYDQATGFGLVRTVLPMQGIEPVELGQVGALETGQALMAVTGAQQAGDDSDVFFVQLVSKRPFSGYWEYHIDSAAFTSPPFANHSGAPLFNQRGELVGIGSLLVSDALGGERRFPGNMFVPVDLLKPILGEMQRTGSSAISRRPWIGISSTERDGRVQIIRVSKNSPAQQAGLQAGDLVLAVDGTTVASLEALYKKLWDRAEPESEILLTVLQGADIRVVRLKAVDRMRAMRKPGGI